MALPPAHLVTIRHDALIRAKQRAAVRRIAGPMVGVAVAAVSAYWLPVGARELWLLAAMYAVVTLGQEVGLHRLFAHHAFKTFRPVQVLLWTAALMGGQGPVGYAVAQHRRHHVYSDTPLDPHSPLVRLENGQERRLGGLRGWWHAQMGYTYFDPPTNVAMFAADMNRDKLLRALDRHEGMFVLLGMLIPAAIAGALGESWIAAWNGFLWGGPVRIFVQHHLMFSNASLSHMYGAQPFDTGDNSRNNWFCAIWSFGSALQNTHHAFASSAFFRYRWYELDLSGAFIRLLEIVGLAWDVRRTPAAEIQARLLRREGPDHASA